MLTTFVDNTFTDKCRILDSGNVVHVCFQKEIFNSLVVKEERTDKMVDDSTCKVIGVETVNITGRDMMVRALEMV